MTAPKQQQQPIPLTVENGKIVPVSPKAVRLGYTAAGRASRANSGRAATRQMTSVTGKKATNSETMTVKN
jgi:hypothetical protein